MNKEQFYTDLKGLEARFEKMNPELEVTVRDPDLGVEAYVVVWNTGVSLGGELGPIGKGGTRIKPDLSIDEIKMLSRRMALKNAASGLPLGGAKSGLKADPDAPDIEQKYRRFVKLSSPNLVENGGIFGGFGWDIGARPPMVHWACDELGSTRSFTGKPVDMGGTDYDKEGIAGLGVSVAAKGAMEHDGFPVEGASFAVQGLGAMGAAVVKYFSGYGGKLHSIADIRIDGTWVFGEAGAPAELVECLSQGNVDKALELLKSGDYKHIAGDTQAVLYQEVDAVMPCAIQDVCSMDNVDQVKTKYWVEGANNPCSKEAHVYMHEKGIMVVPDFIANAGGIIAAYVELSSKATPEENVQTRINVINAKKETESRIASNVKELMLLVRELDVVPDDVGMYIALNNIFKNSQEITQNNYTA